MANGSILTGLGTILLPKGKGVKGGKGATPGFVRTNATMAAPGYRDHLTDLYTSRSASDSRTLMATLVNFDPDVSAAINAFLSVAGSVDPIIIAYDEKDEPSADGVVIGQQLMAVLTTVNDYTLGYSNKPTLDDLCTQDRYMTLMRGGTARELVLDKTYVPSELRLVDPATLTWEQSAPGVYKPTQTPTGSNEKIDLNIPTFFTSAFHQSPLDMYTYSTFVSSINTIASRTLVINELYRIMKIVGYPRVDVQVLQDVLMAAAPPSYRNNPESIRGFVEAELNKIRSTIANLGSADAFVHSNAIEAKVINDKNPSAGLQIDNVIEVLNAQNQAALKVMPAVVGKGTNGQVASTEARLFALSADALNRSIATVYSRSLTLAARLTGFAGRIEVYFPPVELRPAMELEAQKTMKANRLSLDLSRGVISDMEYTMEMYGRPPLTGSTPLSGTGFAEKVAAAPGIDATKATPNSDPLGRSLTGDGHNGTGNNANAGKGSAKKA